MRPKKLTLSAFGPFARRVTVDFEKTGESSLLLIHGQTGGGKTTLLDGMCFALYGESSGGARGAREMRSHHAAETVPTEASLELSVRGHDYIVTRSFRLVGPKGTPKPKQELRVRAPGETAFTTVATKASDIDRYVKELLGLDAAQFRQVVVLPQGRFRELLDASSREREAILETLFDSARFREVEEALKAASGDVRAEVARLERERELVLEHAGADDEEGLSREAAEARARSAELSRRIEEGRALLLAREAALVEIRERQARFVELARVERELERLAREAPEHERRVLSLAAARRAEQVADVVRRRRAARAALEGLVRKHVKAVDAAVSWGKKREEARAALAAFEAREDERSALEEERARLAAALERARALEDARADAAAAEIVQAELAREASALESRRREAEEALAAERERLSDVRARAAGVEEARLRLEDAERRLARAEAFAGAALERASVDEKLGLARLAEEGARTMLAEAERAAADIERRWLDEVAAHLAVGLEDGEGCPVCGALEHPALASSSGGPVPRAAVEEAREQVRVARVGREEARERSRALEHERARADERLSLHAGGDEDLGGVTSSIALAREELRAASEARAQVGALEEAVVSREASCREVTLALAALGPRRAEADAKLAAARAVVVERARGLGDVGGAGSLLGARAEGGVVEDSAAVVEDSAAVVEDSVAGRIVDVKAWLARGNARLDDVKTQLVALATARSRAEDAARGAAAELAAARSLAVALEEERVAREQELTESEQELSAALLAAGFDDEGEVARALLSDEERAGAEALVREHEGRALAARERHLELEEALLGAQLEDPAPLAAEVAHRRSTLEELHRESGLVAGRVALLEGFCEELSELTEALTAARRRFGVVGRLAEAALGEHGGRVTFQRWVLGALLDGVLELASQRLTVMTRGRYTLHRMLGPVARKRSQGLDLAVLDAYTGRERPVSTLSGGESFLTALSLALGLADAVQARTGGVQLECIFVDEGFGGLDPESMDLALDALVQLQGSGRLVGIISHVAELQERIEARLEVVPTRTGSELMVA